MSHALHTDLYQLTMTAAYVHRDMADVPVVCEAFVRRLPPQRSFLLVAGLADVVRYLRELRFTEEQLSYLASLDVFRSTLDNRLRDRLLGFRFTGDLWAMPEGTVAFANEPLVRVEAPLWQAQLVETGLLSRLNHATLVASKAARIVAAARGAQVMEFGSRRTNCDAAVEAARAAYVAGCVGTSNVEAGHRYGIPVFGTMAHMFTMAHPTEAAAFESYLSVFPGSALLVDTYGTLAGVERACAAARAHPDGPRALAAVRVDSELFDERGQPSGLCRLVRRLLDELGFRHTRVVVSDDLNERRIGALLDAGEPIDAFGVGTELVTAKDAPALGGVYKLVSVGKNERPVLKLSPGKVTYPGAHQVWRRHDDDGITVEDRMGLAAEDLPGEPLLEPVLSRGEPVEPGHADDVEQARARARRELASLPPQAILGDRPAIEVAPTPRLRELSRRAAEQLTGDG